MVEETKAPRFAATALTILFVVALFNNMDRALISILQVPIKKDLGLSDAQLGGLTGLAFAAVYAIASLPIGWLVDRYRRTWLLAGALAFWSFLTMLSGFATSYLTLVFCRFGVALGEACGNPATYSLLSDYYPERRRTTVFSVLPIAAFMGVLIGIFAGGWLSSEWGWRQSFIYVGLFGLLLVPFLIWLPEPRRGFHEAPDAAGAPIAYTPPPLRQALRDLFGMPAFRMLVAGMTLQSFVTSTFLNWTAPFLARVHGLPLTEVGLWTALPLGIGGGIGAVISGVVVDRLTRGNRGWYGWASAAASAVLLLVGAAQYLVGSTSLSIAISFLTGALTSFYLAPSFAAAQSLVSPGVRGTTTSILMIIPSILGTGLGPLTAGLISDFLANNYAMGDEALRYGIVLAFIPALGAAWTFYRMGQHLSRTHRAERLSPT